MRLARVFRVFQNADSDLLARYRKADVLIAQAGACDVLPECLELMFLPAVKIVVLNNEFLGMVRQWQQLFFDKRYASTTMTNPDFVAIAKGYHIPATRVTKREELASAVSEMMQSEDAYFLEVCVEKEDNVFPMIPTGSSVSEVRLS